MPKIHGWGGVLLYDFRSDSWQEAEQPTEPAAAELPAEATATAEDFRCPKYRRAFVGARSFFTFLFVRRRPLSSLQRARSLQKPQTLRISGAGKYKGERCIFL